jgi:hypothetical protein
MFTGSLTFISKKGVIFMSISFGGIVLTALVVAVFVIGMKVKSNCEKLQELDEMANNE